MVKLECLLSKEKKDIVSISETWWNENNQWGTVIPRYKLYWKDQEGRIWDRAILYVSVYSPVHTEIDVFTELLWLGIVANK